MRSRRSFYARKEPMFPLYAVLLRLVMFLGIGFIGLTFFKRLARRSLHLQRSHHYEAIILFSWLSKRTHESIHVNGAVVKGLIAAVIGGAITYAVALYLPGGAIVTALIGMVIGGLIALAIVWSDAKQLFNL